jgi:hypothetical protein
MTAAAQLDLVDPVLGYSPIRTVGCHHFFFKPSLLLVLVLVLVLLLLCEPPIYSIPPGGFRVPFLVNPLAIQ